MSEQEYQQQQKEKKAMALEDDGNERSTDYVPPLVRKLRREAKIKQLRARKRIGCGCAECQELERLAVGLENNSLTLLDGFPGQSYEEFVMDESKRETCPYPKNGPVLQNVLRTLPTTPEERKLHPILSGCVDYFPLALAAIARISKAGNDQHNPGQPLHWARGKSTDHGDCILRHLIERGTIDTDGMRHSAKMAWRALALLQEELEAEQNWTPKE